MITRVSFCSHVNKVVLLKGILTHCALNKLAGPFLFSPLGPRCVSCQKGNCQVHFVVNSHILCKWHNILLHSLEKHFHDFTHPMFFFSFLHIYYSQPNNDRKETSIDWYRFELTSLGSLVWIIFDQLPLRINMPNWSGET